MLSIFDSIFDSIKFNAYIVSVLKVHELDKMDPKNGITVSW